MEGFLAAYTLLLAVLLVAAVVFSRLRAPLPRLRRVMRGTGFGVHALGVIGIVWTGIAALDLLVGGRDLFAALSALVGMAAIWWISGGIAMRFGVRREELDWWRRRNGAPQG